MDKQPSLLVPANITPPRKRQGMTLVELILGMALTVLICTAVAVTVKATTDVWIACESADETFRDARYTLARLRAIVKNSRLIGYSTSDVLLLWRSDDNGNSLINYAECAVIFYDPSAEELQFCDIYFPPGTPQGVIDSRNFTLAFPDFRLPATYVQITSDQFCRVRPLAQNVQQFSLALDPDTARARSVTFSLNIKVKDPDVREDFHAVVAMHAPDYSVIE